MPIRSIGPRLVGTLRRCGVAALPLVVVLAAGAAAVLGATWSDASSAGVRNAPGVEALSEERETPSPAPPGEDGRSSADLDQDRDNAASRGAPPTPSRPAGVTRLPEAAVGDEVNFGDGLLATVTAVQRTKVEGMGVGDTSGPAVAVHVLLRNKTDQAVDLALISVDAVDAEGIPAAPARGAPADWFLGELAPVDNAKGVYVFRHDGAAGDLRIDIYNAGSPNIVVVAP